MGRTRKNGRGGGRLLKRDFVYQKLKLLRGWMMTNLLEQKGASSGECFEVGVWWCKKV